MLNVKNLSFSFGTKPLFSNVNFHLPSSSIIRLSGENGTGKSTLMTLLAGLRGGYQGEINYSLDDDSRKLLAWLPADANALDPNLTAMENLKFWQNLRDKAIDEHLIQEHLRQWGLQGEFLTTKLPVGLFSTGMKRRLSIVRLILANASIWLLDEPLFGLDDSACKKFKNLLKSHIDAGRSAIVITHDDRLIDGLNVETLELRKREVTS